MHGSVAQMHRVFQDANPRQEATLKFPYLVVGALNKRAVKNLFRDFEMNGGKVDYRISSNSWVETVYTHLEFQGQAHLLSEVTRVLMALDED